MAKTSRAPSLKESVTVQLRYDIITGVLKPGTILRDLEIADRYQVSTSPVREALTQLTLEGLIDMPPNQPKQVSHIDHKSARDMVFVHRLLAIAAYEIGAPRVDAEGLKTMRQAMTEIRRPQTSKDPAAWMRAIRTFNDVVLRAADNRPLRALISTSYSSIERMVVLWRVHGYMRPERLEAILEALERKEPKKAIRSFREMIEQFQRDIESLATFL